MQICTIFSHLCYFQGRILEHMVYDCADLHNRIPYVLLFGYPRHPGPCDVSESNSVIDIRNKILRPRRDPLPGPWRVPRPGSRPAPTGHDGRVHQGHHDRWAGGDPDSSGSAGRRGSGEVGRSLGRVAPDATPGSRRSSGDLDPVETVIRIPVLGLLPRLGWEPRKIDARSTRGSSAPGSGAADGPVDEGDVRGGLRPTQSGSMAGVILMRHPAGSFLIPGHAVIATRPRRRPG